MSFETLAVCPPLNTGTTPFNKLITIKVLKSNSPFGTRCTSILLNVIIHPEQI